MGNHKIRRVEEYDNGGAIRVSYGEIDQNGHAIQPIDLTGPQIAEWGRIMGILGSNGLRGIVDPIKLSDHCRNNF